jgi:hypothetical protein
MTLPKRSPCSADGIPATARECLTIWLLIAFGTALWALGFTALGLLIANVLPSAAWLHGLASGILAGWAGAATLYLYSHTAKL